MLSAVTTSTNKYKKTAVTLRDISALQPSCRGLHTADFILVFTRGKSFHKKLYEPGLGFELALFLIAISSFF